MINCAESNCVFEWERFVIQLWKGVLENESKKQFFDYLESLKTGKWIIPVVLDSDWMLLNNNLDLVNKNHKKSYLYKKYIEIWDKVSDYIKKILFIEKEFQILDLDWNHIELISKLVLEDIINQTHKKIKVKPWTDLFNNLIQIKNLLENWFSKVSLTWINSIKDEVEWFWTWTLFLDLDKASFKKIASLEILEKIHDNFVEEWSWKKKTKKELNEIFKKWYNIYQINGSILWWYSLQDNYKVDINWEKLEWVYLWNVFTTKNGWGVWKRMINNIKSWNWIVFCHTNARWFFENVKFRKIEWRKTKSWADLYIYINENFISNEDKEKVDKLFKHDKDEKEKLIQNNEELLFKIEEHNNKKIVYDMEWNDNKILSFLLNWFSKYEKALLLEIVKHWNNEIKKSKSLDFILQNESYKNIRFILELEEK